MYWVQPYHFLYDYGLRDMDSISMVDVAVVQFRYMPVNLKLFSI